MAEEERYTLAIVRSSARLRQLVHIYIISIPPLLHKKEVPPYRWRNINSMQLVTHRLLLRMGHRIRHHNSTQLAPINRLNGFATQDSVSDNSHNLFGAVLLQGIRRLDEGAACVCHVIDQNRNLVFNVTDEDHARDFVGSRSFLVDERKVEIESVGNRGGTAVWLSVRVCAGR